MNGNRSLFRDAGADAVGALGLLRPHAPQTCSPVLEQARLRAICAMFDRDTRRITQQDGVPRFTHQSVQAVDFLVSTEDELIERLTEVRELLPRQNARCIGCGWVHSLCI